MLAQEALPVLQAQHFWQGVMIHFEIVEADMTCIAGTAGANLLP